MVPGFRRGGRAELLLGGGISVILLVLFMPTSCRIERLCETVRQNIVAEQCLSFTVPRQTVQWRLPGLFSSFFICFVILL